jgi:hypothetical protein
MPTINFSIDETTSANAQAAATALRSLTQEYQKLNRVLVKTEKQLLKFDEINRLMAWADKPIIRVYPDGKQLPDAATRYQCRDARAQG